MTFISKKYKQLFSLLFLGAYLTFLSAEVIHTHNIPSQIGSVTISDSDPADMTSDPYSDGSSHCLLNALYGSISSHFSPLSEIFLLLPASNSEAPEDAAKSPYQGFRSAPSLRAPPTFFS